MNVPVTRNSKDLTDLSILAPSMSVEGKSRKTLYTQFTFVIISNYDKYSQFCLILNICIKSM